MTRLKLWARPDFTDYLNRSGLGQGNKVNVNFPPTAAMKQEDAKGSTKSQLKTKEMPKDNANIVFYLSAHSNLPCSFTYQLTPSPSPSLSLSLYNFLFNFVSFKNNMVLQFHHRKLIKFAVTVATAETCSDFCPSSYDSEVCSTECAINCPDQCKYNSYLNYPPPPPPPPPPHHPNKDRKLLIISLTLLAAAFIAIAIYGIYVKLYLGWYASRRRSRSEARAINQTHNEFVDEDHGPVVDHHVWYIQTVGLQPSLISAITVCKYKKGDGLVEGTECSVCLNEFQEDETLRLLPKCNHAFHIACIDTWLRSHTNCPMCRAPIVKNSARASSSSSSSSSSSASASNTGNSSSIMESGDARVEVLVENGEAETRLGDDEVVEEEEMVEMQPMRRSVSLDSLSALKISQALANSDAHLAEDRGEGTEIVPKRVSRDNSLARFVASTSSIRRSLSCSGKFLLPRSGCTRG